MARVSIWREVGRRSRGILLTWRLVWKNPGKKKHFKNKQICK